MLEPEPHEVLQRLKINAVQVGTVITYQSGVGRTILLPVVLEGAWTLKSDYTMG